MTLPISITGIGKQKVKLEYTGSIPVGLIGPRTKTNYGMVRPHEQVVVLEVDMEPLLLEGVFKKICYMREDTQINRLFSVGVKYG